MLSKAKIAKTEVVDLDFSLDRISSRKIWADIDVPNFRRSPLDGFAFSSKDTENITKEGKIFKIKGFTKAGDIEKMKGTKNTSIKITTGAPIPEGFDCVIKKEEVREENDEVCIYRSLKKDENIVNIGEDIDSGELLVSAGDIINPSRMGLISSLGISKLHVYKKIRVGILSTGTELVEVGESLKHSQIYNSNFYSLKGSCIKIGSEVINLGIVEDNVEKIANMVLENIDKVDILITTGGASVGEYDLINEVYKRLKAEELFWRVNMKPGTPMLASIYKDKLLIGLSGNPGAALISFEELVKPTIKSMLGQKDFEHKRIKAVLKNDYNKKSIQRRLLRGKMVTHREKNENNYIEICDNQRPGVLKSMIYGDALIDIPANTPFLRKGDIVDVILLD